MKIKIFSCLIATLLLLCSCGTGDAKGETEGVPAFPVTPDKIVIGADGTEKELLPGDKAFDEVVAGIKQRAENTKDYGGMGVDAYDPVMGHLSVELRESEVFVEYIYNEAKIQSFMMGQVGGGSALEDKEVSRIFFPLTGEYHRDMFVSGEAEYNNKTSTLGVLSDNTSLITYIRDLISTETAVE